MSVLIPEILAIETLEYGGAWAVNHSRRLIAQVEVLADGQPYNSEVIQLSAWLHDWGGYPKWAMPGVDHALRSCEVAEEFLRSNGYSDEVVRHVLECIQNHHGGPSSRSFESLLFTDADALDLLGVVGTLRIFAMYPRDLSAGRNAVMLWLDNSMHALMLEKSKTMALERAKETQWMLERFEIETMGLF